jgi:hypothetical protein
MRTSTPRMAPRRASELKTLVESPMKARTTPLSLPSFSLTV